MQGGERQVTSLGDTQSGFDGFQVAHFADEHHVRIFAERGAQGVGEGVRVGVDFALVHQALLVIVEELDGVLDGDHVLFMLVVDFVEHGRERGGLARAGRPGHEHEAARLVAQRAHDVGKAESVKALDLPRNGTKHGGHRAALVKDVAAETGQALQTEGEVEFEVFLEPVLLHVGKNAVGQRLGVCRGERGHVERAQLAVHANARRAIGGEVQVAASHFDHLLEQFTECDASHYFLRLQNGFSYDFFQGGVASGYLNEAAATQGNHSVFESLLL